MLTYLELVIKDVLTGLGGVFCKYVVSGSIFSEWQNGPKGLTLQAYFNDIPLRNVLLFVEQWFKIKLWQSAIYARNVCALMSIVFCAIYIRHSEA